MIYAYVAASKAAPEINEIKTKFDHHGLGCTRLTSHLENQASILQPGLFRTCSQIHAESRLIFYRTHAFKLHIWHEGPKRPSDRLTTIWYVSKACVNRVTRWLDAIRPEAIDELQTLKFEVHYDYASRVTVWTAYTQFINHLYNKLFNKGPQFLCGLDIELQDCACVSNLN